MLSLLSVVHFQWQVDEEASVEETQTCVDATTLENGPQEKETRQKSTQTIIIYVVILLVVLGGVGYQQWQVKQAEPAMLEPAPHSLATSIPPGGAEQPDLVSPKYALSKTTKYFQLIYQPQDAITIQAIAPALDQLYATMWQAINPSPLVVDKKLLLEITPEVLPTGWQVQPDRIIVSSLIRVDALSINVHTPDGTVATSVLLTDLKDAFAEHLLRQAVDTTQIHSHWQLALVGFRHWLRDVPYTEHSQANPWAHPCRLPEQANVSHPFPAYRFSDADWTYPYKQAEQIELAQSVAAYVAQIYGPSYIHAMLQAFAHQQGWQALIQHVFQQSPVEFATGRCPLFRR